MRPRVPLPIDPFLEPIFLGLEERGVVVLKASPGAGKTTRVPPYLTSRLSGQVLVLEPRRVAAKLSALRVADEQGWRVGGEVGYQFRSEAQVGASTRLIFLTEGLLIRKLISNPQLQGVSAVILDEFHERHLHGDLALSILRDLRSSTRPDLKLLVMSATLESEKLQSFLGAGAPIVVEVQRFPVEQTHLKTPITQSLEREVSKAIQGLPRDCGDILVFLPGRREILACRNELLASGHSDEEIFPLYGELPVAEQQRALNPIQGLRRIILSTNIAETSLTIEGVKVVIDSGLQRRASFSPWSGVPLLELKTISRASAIQRAGRAGRLGPGRCLRLYTEADFKARLEFEAPEILRSDLLSTALELASLGKSEIQWLESPRESNWKSAIHSLEFLGLMSDGRITPLGREVVRWPVSPRFGLAFELAARASAEKKVFELIANLAEGELQDWDPEHPLEFRSGVRAQRLLDTLRLPQSMNRKMRPEEIGRLLFQAFADRVGKLRRTTPDVYDFTLAFGGSVQVPKVHPSVRSSPDFILAIEAFQSGQGTKLQVGSPVNLEWLQKDDRVIVKESVLYDEFRRKVTKRSGYYFGELSLEEFDEPLQESDRPAVGEVLKRVLLGSEDLTTLPKGLLLERLRGSFDVATLKTALAKLRLLEGHQDLLSLKLPSDWLERGLSGLSSLVEVEGIDWLSVWVESEFQDQSYAIQTRVQSLLPDVVMVGSRKVKIHYELDQNPWIESRIQDFFGMSAGPSILNGRIPLTLHLLAPNQRAVQVTQDLSGFWSRHYPTLRQELSRNYPKHKWPLDPLQRS